MTIREALDEAAGALEQARVPSPRVDAEWLLANVLGMSRTGLALAGRAPDADELQRFRALVARRAAREPLAYILGEWGFRRLTLTVDGRVLIPRPETEALVDVCLSLLEEVAEPRVLDIGVGSGAIALALADERPDLRVVGTDVSPEALAVAELNRARANVDGRVRFVRGDLAAEEPGPFDLVVSNPPYVTSAELGELEPELRHEPREALVGEGGHRAVASVARELLAPGGALALEVGDGQAEAVADEVARLGFHRVTVSRDLAGRERIVSARLP